MNASALTRDLPSLKKDTTLPRLVAPVREQNSDLCMSRSPVWRTVLLCSIILSLFSVLGLTEARLVRRPLPRSYEDQHVSQTERDFARQERQLLGSVVGVVTGTGTLSLTLGRESVRGVTISLFVLDFSPHLPYSG